MLHRNKKMIQEEKCPEFGVLMIFTGKKEGRKKGERGSKTHFKVSVPR